MPQITIFSANGRVRKDIDKVMGRGLKSRMGARDEVFAEMMKLNRNCNAELLEVIWNKCGEFKFLPGTGQTAVREDPASYSQVAVMLHEREVVESAFPIKAGKHYKFCQTQLGFQEGTSTETVIIRHNTATRKVKIRAVLDLNSPFDKVPRSLMMDLVKQEVFQHLHLMIPETPQALKVVKT